MTLLRCMATLYLPAASAAGVKESGRKAGNSRGIRFIKFVNGKAIYELGSGIYEFISEIGDTEKVLY